MKTSDHRACVAGAVSAGVGGVGSGIGSAVEAAVASTQDGNHLRCVTPLAGRDDKLKRADPTLPGKVDLACEPAWRASQGLIGTVTCRAPTPTRDLRDTGGGAGRVLMSATGRGIDTDHAPVDPALCIGVGLDGPQDSLPRAIRRPPAMTVVDRLPARVPDFWIVSVKLWTSRCSNFGGEGWTTVSRPEESATSCCSMSNVIPFDPWALTMKPTVRSRTLFNGSVGSASTRYLIPPLKSSERTAPSYNCRKAPTARTLQGISAPMGGSSGFMQSP